MTNVTDYKKSYNSMKAALALSEECREIERAEAAREAANWRASNKNLLDANAALLKIAEEQAAEIACLRQRIKNVEEIGAKNLDELGKEIILGIAEGLPAAMKNALTFDPKEASRALDNHRLGVMKKAFDFTATDTLTPTKAAKAKNPKKASK